MGEVRSYIHHEMRAQRELRECHVAKRIEHLGPRDGRSPSMLSRHRLQWREQSSSPPPAHTAQNSKGDPVMVDIGFYFGNGLYATDMTRTFLAHPDAVPHPRLVEVYPMS